MLQTDSLPQLLSACSCVKRLLQLLPNSAKSYSAPQLRQRKNQLKDDVAQQRQRAFDQLSVTTFAASGAVLLAIL
jgi:hypothetical protein